MKYISGIAIMLLGGCMLFSPGPDDVAEDFWAAAQAGDEAAMEELSLAFDNNRMDAATNDVVESITLGEHMIDGERATVTTTVETSDDRIPTFEFSTVLAHTDEGWLVDMDATTGEMFKAVMSQSVGAVMDQVGGAVREGMAGVMEGVSKGISEGMRGMADALSNAADSTARR